MNCGIYKIRFIGSDKIYYGSTNNFDRRKRQHLSDLSQGKHKNTIMQNLYNKYGKENLVFEKVSTCQRDQLIEIEQEYIDNMDDATAINISKTAGGGKTSALSGDDVVEVFRLRGKENKTIESLAKKFNTSKGVIYKILLRVTMPHIEVPQEYIDLARQNKGDKFTNEDILDMFNMWNSGSTINEIKEKYNFRVSSKVIEVLRRERYKRVDIPQEVIDKANSRPITDKAFAPTQETINEIFRLKIDKHLTDQEIADKFGVKAKVIYRILNRLSYKKFPVCESLVIQAKEVRKEMNKAPEYEPIEYSSTHIPNEDIEQVVLGVFEDTAAGMTRKAVAVKYQKSPQWVTDVLKRRTYPNLTIPEDLLKRASGRLKKNVCATDEQVIEMFKMFKQGKTYQEIAIHMGMSEATVYGILTRRTRKDVILPEYLVSKIVQPDYSKGNCHAY